MDENTKTTEMENQTQEQQATASGAGDPNAAPPAADGAAADQQAAAGKNYTDEQLAELKVQWQQEYEQSKAAEKDFKNLTPEQQAQKRLDDQKAETARLQAELADRDLTDYARGKISEAKLPADALTFIKGKDQADTDAKIKAFSALLASGVQAGVEERFKTNGYTPRSSAAGASDASGSKKTRGVAINPTK